MGIRIATMDLTKLLAVSIYCAYGNSGCWKNVLGSTENSSLNIAGNADEDSHNLKWIMGRRQMMFLAQLTAFSFREWPKKTVF